MWFTGLLKYSRMERQIPRKRETFQKCDDTLQTENEDFIYAKQLHHFPQTSSRLWDGQQPCRLVKLHKTPEFQWTCIS